MRTRPFLLVTFCVFAALGCGESPADEASREAIALSIRQLNVLYQEIEENLPQEQTLTRIRVPVYYNDYVGRAQAVRAKLAETPMSTRFTPVQQALDSVVVRTVALLQLRSEQMAAAMEASVAYRAVQDAVQNAERSYYTGYSFINEAVEEEHALLAALERARAGNAQWAILAESLTNEAQGLNRRIGGVGVQDTLVLQNLMVPPDFLQTFFAKVESFKPEYGRYQKQAEEVRARLASKTGA